MSGAVRTINIAVLLGVVALQAYFLHYMDRLKAEGCACALGWHRTFIEAALVFFILHTLLVIGVTVAGVRDGGIMAALRILSFALTIAYVIVAREFLTEVAQSHCDCARGTAYNALNVINIAVIALLLLIPIMAIVEVMSGGRAPLGGKPPRPPGR